MPHSGCDRWRTAKQSFLALSYRTGERRFQRYYRGIKREASLGVESLLRDNINQRTGLRYFFRLDHSLLVGFDRYRRRILGLISNKAYLGFHHENLSWVYGANCRH